MGRQNVGCRKAKLPATPHPRTNHAVQTIGAAKQSRGQLYFPAVQSLANPGCAYGATILRKRLDGNNRK
ncbi:MAG: hypothetical protein HW416_3856, partial [Chloroflexi bacterium]|nr:hypothetical protein [Chloroflexota bacterium]